jgi:hypothetical protein
MPTASPSIAPTIAPTVTYFRVEAKMGIAGFCADDFPWEPFKEAMVSQVGSPVTITGVVDDSDACSRRRLGGASFGQQRRQLPVAIKQAKVSFEIYFAADEQGDADVAISTLSSLNATAFEATLETRIIFYYGSVPADFGVPPGAIEAPQTIHVSLAPTAAPTIPPILEPHGDYGSHTIAGMAPWQFSLVVVGVILLLSAAYISTQKKLVVKKKVEKVFATADEESKEEEEGHPNPTISGPPTPKGSDRRPRDLVISGTNPGYNPTVTAADNSDGDLAIYPIDDSSQVTAVTIPQSPHPAPALSPAAAEAPTSPQRLVISSGATRGPPLDLFVNSMVLESDDEEEWIAKVKDLTD